MARVGQGAPAGTVKLARGAPIVVNHAKALISKIYNFGIGRGLVDHNPCFGVPMPAKARQRNRVLDGLVG